MDSTDDVLGPTGNKDYSINYGEYDITCLWADYWNMTFILFLFLMKLIKKPV
jgi:hypothetical protein